MLSAKELRTAMQGATAIPKEVLDHIYKQRWLQLWVPQSYGGLGCDFKTGLAHLYAWAKIDGSLGWMLTLCAGANYFSRNMIPTTAKKLFANEHTCFGGSGMVGGTADEQEDGSFIIQGLWHYATGAPYLSHFTLNAQVFKQGKPMLDEEGNPCIRSFIVPHNKVKVIPNWNSMGMQASGTFSFQVDQVSIPADYHFAYDTFYTNDLVTQIPFGVFADLTLIVNYLGLAQHFMEEAEKNWEHPLVHTYQKEIEQAYQEVLHYAHQVECGLLATKSLELQIEEIHIFGVQVVERLTLLITQVYVQLGIKATQLDQPIYRVFCDFFTATQHRNFRMDLTL